jgi:short-subunit dehydrogenase
MGMGQPPGVIHELNYTTLVQPGGQFVHIVTALAAGGLITGIPTAWMAKFMMKRMIVKKMSPMKNINEIEPTYALVTGASRGLGREIARELAVRRYNLILVALTGEELPQFSTELSSSYKVEVHYLEANLSEPQTVFQVASWAMSKGTISILINNAGIGGTKAFDLAPAEYIDNIIQLNIRATSLLTRLLLPELKSSGEAYILNVSSMASFSPVAYKTVYPASKAFIWSFSRGLHEELKNTCVFVSVVHPGPMKTNPDVIRRIEKQKIFGKIGLISTEKTARIAVKRLLKKDSLIIPGFLNKVNWMMIQIVPVWLRLNLLSRVIRRELKDEHYVMAVNK